ncbi:MAG: hypothetical protein GX442_25940 [Candidatus Riflebacteria bacterium]|nr:hypothetical protein [Candidatus Riflebacteria bacterium]
MLVVPLLLAMMAAPLPATEGNPAASPAGSPPPAATSAPGAGTPPPAAAPVRPAGSPTSAANPAPTAAPALPPLPPGEEIYDLRPPVPVPYPWLQTIGETALWLALAWVAWRLLAWLLAPAVRVPRPPRPVDHRQEALKALDRLRSSPVWDPTRLKDVCERVSLILKVFLHDQFGLGLGGAATTDELLGDLRRNRVPVSLVTRSDELLGVCDEVRYARGSLAGQPLDELYRRVRELLLRGDWRV